MCAIGDQLFYCVEILGACDSPSAGYVGYAVLLMICLEQNKAL